MNHDKKPGVGYQINVPCPEDSGHRLEKLKSKLPAPMI